MEILSETLENSRTGVLATTDAEGRPSMRWMTPTILGSQQGLLYAVTSRRFAKKQDLENNPHGHWLIQTKALNRIINISGVINLIDNPSLRAEVIEAIGPHLRVFWKINEQPEDLIVLETIMERGSVFTPLSGERLEIEFPGGTA
ncbi:MAG: pyridoxamine 5'-phosphate oxidase family protein [Spirochaetales bacterium]|nr:pyridoxamine 5'-phosphate oxidase family protein [Spirochaetales bacterium]